MKPAADPGAAEDVMDMAPVALTTINAEGGILFANRHLENLFGYERGALAGRPIETLLPNRFHAAYRDHISGYLRSLGVRSPAEGRKFVGLRADGLEFQINVILGPAEGLGHAVAMAAIHDASAQDAAERKGRQDDQLIRSLVDGIVDYAVFMLDPDGTILTWNAGAQIIKGYEASEVIGRHFGMLFTPEDRASGKPLEVLDTARRERRFQAEGWRVRRDGSRFLAHLTLDAIRDEEGMVIGFAKITRDVTEQRRREAMARDAERMVEALAFERNLASQRERAAHALQRTAETLNAVIAASPLGLFVINTDGVYEIWNPFCESLMGYSAAEIIGRDYLSVAAQSAIEGEPTVHEFFPPRNGGGEREVRRRARDGTVLNLIISSAPIRGREGRPAGYVYTVTDVTERRVIEEQLHQAQKMEAVGQLTGGIAHDFNNLLSIIICNLEFILEDAPPRSETLDFGQMALEAALRGAELIRRLLTFARKQPLESRVVQVGELAVDIVAMLRRTLGEHITITMKTQPRLWPSILDPVQLQTAIANLATNARDAMPEGGHLAIEITNATLDVDYVRPIADIPAGDYVLITVSDTGRGMSAEVAARAFEPFFTTKPAGQGTGLGMSMVFGFVKQSGGHVRIHSEPGHGTTVKMYLRRAHAGEATLPEPEDQAQAARSGTVLVVEDNVDLARSVEAMLRLAGMTPIIAHDATEALGILDRREAVDLLLTDIVLGGGMNGVDLAAEATARRPDLKVLFTSGFAETVLTHGGAALVADRLLSKPYRRQELVEKIAAVLGGAPLDLHSFAYIRDVS